MDELLEALKKLMGHDDRKVVVQLLQEHGHPLYQSVFDRGHAAATAAAANDKKQLENQVVQLTKERDDAAGKLTELQGQQPDVAKIHEQYKEEIRGLKEAHRTALEAEQERNRTAERSRAAAELQALLGGQEFGVHEKMAALYAKDPDVLNRISFDDKGNLVVMQKDKAIPFDAADRTGALKLLAKELTDATDPDFIVSKADRGSDTGGQAAGGTGSIYDEIRSNRQKKQGAQEKQESRQPTAEERLGMRQ